MLGNVITTQDIPTSLNQATEAMSAQEQLPQTSYDPSSTASSSSSSSRQTNTPQFTLPAGTHWPSTNFVLAAGTATFQPSTGKVVVIEDTALRPTDRRTHLAREEFAWFLPRGRKDRDETLEQCAVRETFEEAGYAATILKLPAPTLQPRTADTGSSHREAIHVQLLPFLSRRHRLPTKITDCAIYMAFWYVCAIPYNAVRDPDYGEHFVGAHEKGYNSELVSIEEAVKLLSRGRLEYRYPESNPGNGVPGRLVEGSTGIDINWANLDAGDSGAVEAFIVAQGWELLRAGNEWEDAE